MKEASTERYFVALPIPAAQRSGLKAWVCEKKEEWPFTKWVHEADYHLTLQFLGNVAAQQLNQVKEALTLLARETVPFRLAMEGIGTFGRPDRPQILWVGATGELERLHALQSLVTARMRPLGFKPDDRPYRPHITLARKYRQSRFPYDRLNEISLSPEIEEPWLVEGVVLYRSHLGRIPMYEAIGWYPFEHKKEVTP
jgi:2'-5' RNA ligase